MSGHAGKEKLYDPWVQWALFFGLLALPALLSAVTAGVAFERSKTLQFCSSCHVMEPWVSDLKDSGSETLASKHYQYRRINHNQCYTCHTDYDFMGPVKAKMRGMQHLAAYYMGSKAEIKLYKPFPNGSCLQCHDGEKSFMAAATHKDVMDQLRSDEMQCISCHGPAHPERGGTGK